MYELQNGRNGRVKKTLRLKTFDKFHIVSPVYRTCMII